MLILTRKPGQKIILSHEALPEDIVLEYFPLPGGKIQMGITAPKSVQIMRAELLEGKTATQPKPREAA